MRAIELWHRLRFAIAGVVLAAWLLLARCGSGLDEPHTATQSKVIAGNVTNRSPQSRHDVRSGRAPDLDVLRLLPIEDRATPTGDVGVSPIDGGQPRDFEGPTPPRDALEWPTIAYLADGGTADVGDMMRDIFVIVDPKLDECVARALTRTPSLYGVLAVSVKTTPKNGRHTIVGVDFDPAFNQVVDAGLLECARSELLGLELDDVPGDTFGSTTFVKSKAPPSDASR